MNPNSISIVIPLFNEAGNVARLVAEVAEAMDDLEFELILVEDGSTDGTRERIEEASQADARVRAVYLAANFGQSAALVAGFERSTGQVVVTMDGDLQNDPADIPRLLQRLDEGYDVVAGWRVDRKGSLVLRRLPSIVANWIVGWVLGGGVHDNGCGLKAFRREILDRVRLYGEGHRILLAQAAQLGARMAEVRVNDRERTYGQSKYGVSRTYKVILDLLALRFLSSFAVKPIHVFGGIGLLLLLAAVGTGIGLIVWRLAGGGYIIQTPLLLLASVMFIVGMLLVLMGLQAELIVRLYHDMHGGPVYHERLEPCERRPERRQAD